MQQVPSMLGPNEHGKSDHKSQNRGFFDTIPFLLYKITHMGSIHYTSVSVLCLRCSPVHMDLLYWVNHMIC